MEFNSLPLAPNFNTLYTDVLNCDIVPPSFYTWRVPNSFVFKKRWAFSAVAGAQSFDTIYDIYEEGADRYYIGKIGSNVLVKKNGTTLYTSAFVANVHYKFFTTQWPKWTVSNSGTAGNGVISWTDVIVRDSTKTFTVNAYASQYLYVYEADVGQWQVFRIDSNTATDMVITSTGYFTLPVNAKYKIFPSYGYVLSFVAGDYIYNIQDATSVTPIKSIPSTMDAVFFNGNYYILAQDKNVHVWGDGIFAAYFSSKSNVGSVPDTMNIINFKDYILLIWPRSIHSVRNVQRIDTFGNRVTDRMIIPVTSDVWMYSQGSYTVFNTWLYLVTQNKKFVGVDIKDVGIDKFTVTVQNQWLFIQQFLDTLVSTETVRIGINDENIYIIVKGSGKTTIYNYDILYSGWHRWETLLAITNFKLNQFVGTTLYTKLFAAWTDQWSLSYNQTIRAILGEDLIYLMKRAILTKIYIGKRTTKNSYLEYTVMAWWNVDKYTKKLEESAYIQDVLWYWLQTTWTLGSQLLWLSLLWASSTDWLDLLADFALIENPTWFFYEILILDIKWTGLDEFEFWGMIMWFQKFEPQVTSYKNVI